MGGAWTVEIDTTRWSVHSSPPGPLGMATELDASVGGARPSQQATIRNASIWCPREPSARADIDPLRPGTALEYEFRRDVEHDGGSCIPADISSPAALKADADPPPSFSRT